MRENFFLKRGRLFIFLLLAAALPVRAAPPEKEPEIPPGLSFIRSFDSEVFVERQNRTDLGAQTLRLRTRYLDPDVNAFVGILTNLSHFNQDLRIGSPTAPDTAATLWNIGLDVGLKKGRTLWELDLMGAVLSAQAGPALAVVGEHTLGAGWTLYHRTEADIFSRDTVLDLDQGFFYQWKTVGISAGYRIFAAAHMNRSGPRIGAVYRFESPKIPFFFPSP